MSPFVATVISGALAIVIAGALVECLRGIRKIFRRLDVIEQVLHIGNGWKVPNDYHQTS